MYEADEQFTHMYRLLKQEQPEREVYILSEDGDCFFNQLPWIPFLNLDHDHKK